MNQTPLPQKTHTPQEQPPKNRKPSPDLTYPVLILTVAVTVMISILFVLLLFQKPHTSPSDAPKESTSGQVSRPPDSELSNPVTYPSAPSRNDYLLSGNGEAIDPDSISASSAILVSLSDYSVKASLSPDERIYPASMTKIMTLIVACENIKDASVLLTIDQTLYDYCTKAEATTLVATSQNYPIANDSFTATDMLYAVATVSAADACLALANHIAGSEEAFVALMNEKCTELGLTGTHFANCTGLDDDANYSTVREMAIILAYALDNPFCKDALTTFTRTAVGTYNADVPFPYNRYLTNTLAGRLKSAGYEEKLPQKLKSGMTILGGKTGYTTAGKYCLASFAKDAEGNLYITVTAAGEKPATSITDIDAIYKAHP